MFNLFYKNSPCRTSLALLLTITMLFLAGAWVLFYPKPVQAVWGVGDIVADPIHTLKTIYQSVKDAAKWAWEKVQAAASRASSAIRNAYLAWQKSDTLLARVSRVAAQIALHTLLNMLTNDIIKWIQGGGEPRFISDWEGFLSQAGGKAGGLFVDKYLGAGWLCEPFDVAIKIPLQPIVTFEEKVKCTLEDMGINIRMFYDDFEEGGWAGWIELTKPQGNFYGGYLIAQTEKINREQAAKDAAGQEGGAGRGFLSVKACIKGYTIHDLTGEKDETCNTKESCIDLKATMEPEEGDEPGYSFICEKEIVSTPASVLSDVTSRAIDRPMESLSRQVADLTDSLGSYAPYIIAISNALINRVIEEGLAEIQRIGPTEEEPDIPLPASMLIAEIETPAQAGAAAEMAVFLVTQQELLKENLETRLLPQQESNLEATQNIEAIQRNILTILTSFLCFDCPLPSSLPTWADSQLISTVITDPATERTVKTFKITASGIGSIRVKKITWVEWEGDLDVTVCDEEIVETTLQMSDQIPDSEEDVNSTNQWIADTATAITSTNDFIDEVNEYTALYDATPYPPTDEEQAALDAKRDEVDIALQLLIADGQTAAQSLAEDVGQLSSDTLNTIMTVNQTTDDLLQFCGFSEDYPEEGTLYAQKKSLIEDIFPGAQSALLNCSGGGNGDGNGGY